MQKLVTNLWFNGNALEAAKFYTSIFPNSSIDKISYYTKSGEKVGSKKEGDVLTVDYTLEGQRYTGINAGDEFTFSEATSIMINCKDQQEVDYYWAKLTEGGKESYCGWLKDKFGFSWQVVPVKMNDLITDPDPVKAERAMAEMLKTVGKLDLAKIERAHAGK